MDIERQKRILLVTIQVVQIFVTILTLTNCEINLISVRSKYMYLCLDWSNLMYTALTIAMFFLASFTNVRNGTHDLDKSTEEPIFC